jgi:hypothetical protein
MGGGRDTGAAYFWGDDLRLKPGRAEMVRNDIRPVFGRQ